MDYIENRTFDEIAIGESASITRVLSQEDILLFAAMSGDINPAHVDEEFARSDIFQKVIAHGMWGGALISTVLGTVLPGPGTIYVGQSLQFHRPVTIGDQITVTVTATEKIDKGRRVTFACACTNQDGDDVITGTAEVLGPKEKIKRPAAVLPEVRVYDRYARYRDLMHAAEPLPLVPTAVVHPVDRVTLSAILEARKSSLIEPILVGPEPRIKALAEEEGLNIGDLRIVPTEHSHESAARACAMAAAGEVQALMKGTLTSKEIMRTVRNAGSGLLTDRRMSHVFALDVPGYPRALFLTDAVVNAYPTLDDKRDIVQNAIDLAHALGRERPQVALLTAVETINTKVRSTLEAAALCKMADRGQITGADLDGPLAFDTAVSKAASAQNDTRTSIAGTADILVVPDVQVGQMLVQQLETLAGIRTAGLVVGARVPIVLSGPGDTEGTLTASCAMASLLHHGAMKGEDEGPKPPHAVPQA